MSYSKTPIDPVQVGRLKKTSETLIRVSKNGNKHEGEAAQDRFESACSPWLISAIITEFEAKDVHILELKAEIARLQAAQNADAEANELLRTKLKILTEALEKIGTGDRVEFESGDLMAFDKLIRAQHALARIKEMPPA